MAFLETPRFSDRIARNVTGGPQFLTDIIALRSGFEQRNGALSQARLAWDAATAARKLPDFQEIEDHFLAVSGRLHGFRIRDWADYLVTTANGVLRPLHGSVYVSSPGFGFGVPVLQLAKKYTRGAFIYYRDTRKPVSGQVTVRRGGATVTVGAGAGNIAIDTTTGRITFVADQSRAVSAHVVGAAHKFTLASAFSPNASVGQRVYATGVTGTAAGVLNDLSHQVTIVSGADVTVSTNTTGLSASGGTLALYPQASEALDWLGQFDVPARFDTDHLQRRLLARGPDGVFLVECPSIPIIEIRV